MQIKVINKSSNELPKYAHPVGDSGVDLRAELSTVNEKFLFNSELITNNDNSEKVVVINPGGRALIPTELYTEIPIGYEVQIRPRSGLALKNGMTVCNTPGTIDASYRNNWGVILINLGTEPFVVCQGDRIAQAVLIKVETIEWEPVEVLEDSERGLGGFGSTNIQ
jgi:dUTP pyrophosphatase